jgi:hypothetical protein
MGSETWPTLGSIFSSHDALPPSGPKTRGEKADTLGAEWPVEGGAKSVSSPVWVLVCAWDRVLVKTASLGCSRTQATCGLPSCTAGWTETAPLGAEVGVAPLTIVADGMAGEVGVMTGHSSRSSRPRPASNPGHRRQRG